MAEYVLRIAEMLPRDGSVPAMPGSNGSVARLYTPCSTASTVEADWAKDGESADMGGDTTERPRSNRYTRKIRGGLWAQQSVDADAAELHLTEASHAETRHHDDASVSQDDAQRDSEWMKHGQMLTQTVRELDSNPSLKWVEVVEPTCSTEIKDKTLAAALRRTKEFSAEEWKTVGANSVTADCYIRVGDKFFQPAQSVVAKTPCPTPIGGRYLSEEEVEDMEQVLCSCESPKVPSLARVGISQDRSNSRSCSAVHAKPDGGDASII